MQLNNPPIGLAAVKAFYKPLSLTEFSVACGTRTFHITAHVKAAPNIRAFFEIVQARGLSGLIRSYDGCYVNRPKRLSSQPSMHAYGAAFDINAAENPQGGKPTLPAALVTLAAELGFFWGGDFAGRFVDGMHLQLGTDFALNGRPVPRVTYKEEVAAPKAALPTYRALKVFDAVTGAELYQHIGPVTVGVVANTVIARASKETP